MIVEIADIEVLPQARAAFAEAVTRAADTVLAKADGYRSHRILAGHESPGRFVLVIEWASLEAHTVGFRQSPAFAEWRAIIGQFFAKPPRVEHFEVVAAS